MTEISAYLNFNGNCREAMTFYQSCFGGNLTLQTIGETESPDKCAKGTEDLILHATLISGGIVLMGSDMVGPAGFIQGNTISLALNCSSEQEINHLFSKLSADGQIFESVKEMFWGGLFGALRDKFGIQWMLNYDKTIAAGEIY